MASVEPDALVGAASGVYAAPSRTCAASPLLRLELAAPAVGDRISNGRAR